MSNETRSFYKFGSFRFDAQTKTLWRETDVVSLPPKSLELLKLLIERHGEIVSKQEIFDTVWADTFVEDGVLTQNIYTLRQTLGTNENGKQVIENLARRGYRLTLPVILETDKLPETGRERDEDSEILTRSTELSNNQSRQDPAASPRRPVSAFLRPTVIVSIIAFIGIALTSFVGYRLFVAKEAENPKTVTAELKFKQLTDTGDVSYLAISPNGNSSVYTRGNEIFRHDLAGNVEVKINSENLGKVGCLQISPDETFVYFANINNRDEKGNIYRITQAGGNPELIAEDVWSGFSISPDGKEIAFVRKIPNENKQKLLVKNLESQTEKVLKALPLPEEFYWNNYPAWSADGSKIAMVAVSQTEHFSRILIIDKNGNEQELKPKYFRNIEQIVWNADGRSLIASANVGNNFQLWKVSTTDENHKRITNDLNSYLGISISQDRKKLLSRQRIYFSNIWIGQKDNLNNLKQMTNGTSRNDGLNGLAWIDEEKIVYTSNDEKIRDWNLWMLKTSDNSRQKLTSDTEIQNDFPTVSPDKQMIYFASDRNKESRIWRMKIDGGNLEQVTFGEDETHHFPQISPDGKWLYFIIKSGRSSTIGRKSLEQVSVQELTGKTKFVAGNFLSLSPDGKFLAFQNIGYAAENKPNSAFQIALMPTADPQNVTFTNLNSFRQTIRWSEDSKYYDYIAGNFKQSTIMRQPLENSSPPLKLLETNDAIFTFAWSPSGQNLAISRGQLLRDVIYLTDFDY